MGIKKRGSGDKATTRAKQYLNETILDTVKYIYIGLAPKHNELQDLYDLMQIKHHLIVSKIYFDMLCNIYRSNQDGKSK